MDKRFKLHFSPLRLNSHKFLCAKQQNSIPFVFLRQNLLEIKNTITLECY